MNRTDLVPEDTVTVAALGQNRSCTGHLTFLINKTPGVHMEITGDGFNFFRRYKCPSIPFAAITAFFAAENDAIEILEISSWETETASVFMLPILIILIVVTQID